MKIAIIGTTSYLEKMENHKRILLDSFGRHYIRLPRFDSDDLNELEICEKNREMIEWADEVHIFWDQRSMGTVFDFGMCFALRKLVKVMYLEPKTMAGVMKKYEEETKDNAEVKKYIKNMLYIDKMLNQFIHQN